MPLVVPALLTTTLLIFVQSFTSFNAPVLVNRNCHAFPIILCARFVGRINNDSNFTTTVTIVTVIVAALIFLIRGCISGGGTFTLGDVRPIRRQRTHGNVGTLIRLIICLMINVTVVPRTCIVCASFGGARNGVFISNCSLRDCRATVNGLNHDVRGAVVVPLLTLIIVILLTILVTCLIIHHHGTLAGIISVLSVVPCVIPNAILNVTLLVNFGGPPLLVDNAVLVVMMTLVVQHLPCAVHSSITVLRRVPVDVRRTTVSLNTSGVGTFFHVAIPVVTSNVVSNTVLD